MEIFLAEQEGFVSMINPEGNDHYCVIPVEPGMTNSPLDCWIEMFKSLKHNVKIKPIHTDGFYFMAEQEGFEPSVPFWGTHDFQSCPL